jgi:hypothetical protein
MIRYSLICDSEHEFESWFASSEAFEAQAARGLVECPVCGSARTTKAIMAPRLAARRDHDAPAAVPATATADQAGQPMAMASGADHDLRAMLRTLRDHIKAHADDVGEKFPELARKMHYGEAERRSIYGQSSLDEARALRDEGIEVHPLPILPEDRN